MNKKFWIRQVIVPGIMDNVEYLVKLSNFLKTNIISTNIERIDFLPFHTLGKEKYQRMGIEYPLGDMVDMDKAKCNELYNRFKKKIGKIEKIKSDNIYKLTIDSEKDLNDIDVTDWFSRLETNNKLRNKNESML